MKRVSKQPTKLTTDKPTPDFPLTPHRATNRWCKKVRGKIHYFGPLDKPQEALAKWLEQKDDLLAGRTPQTKSDGLTLGELANRFLAAKRQLVDNHELSSRTWADYYATCRFVLKTLGKNKPVAMLVPTDFQMLRGEFSKTRAAVALGNNVQRTRTLLKWAFDNELIEKPIRFGSEFKRPNKKTLRKARQAKGKRTIPPAELRQLIEQAGQPLKTMILLGINCGFGNADCATLPLSAIDLEAGFIDYPRPKTAIERRAPLWTETIAVLGEWLAVRPIPKHDDAKELVFVTKYGASWSKSPDLTQDEKGNLTEAFVDNPVSKEFRKLLNKTKLYVRGRSFYTLRHVFETVAGGSRDQVAVDYVMGHTDPSMAAEYREEVADDRLRDVVNHVRDWLYADADADDQDDGPVTLRLHSPEGDEPPARKAK